MKTQQRSLYYLLLVVGAILLFAHLGKLYVDIMEARNFVSAREMADEGHWIFTTMNGLPRYEKPPLPTWLSAWMGEIFSFRNIGALRFPAALSTFLLVIYFYKIVNFLSSNTRLAFISSMVLVTNFLVIYVGRRANWDIYSYSFMVIGIYYFILALKDIKTIPNYLFAGVLFGFSVLSKGPTGPYVLLIPLYIGYVIVFGWPKWKEIRGIILCAIVTILVGFSWYIYIYTADPDTFLAIMEKEATARGNRDVKPFTRYLSFPVQTGVWILYSVIGLIFPMIKKRTDQPKIYMLFFYWTLFSLILLSLIPSKKERYLFPMMVPLAATTGYYLYYLFQSIELKRWELNLNKTIFTVLAVVAFAIAAGVYFLPLESISIYTVLFSISALMASVGLLYFIYKKRSFEKAFYSVVFLMAATGLFGIPVLDKMLSNNQNFKSLTLIKDQIQKEGTKLYSYSEYSPEVWFRYLDIMPEIKTEDPKTFPKEKVFYVAMNTNQPEFIKNLEKLGWKLTYVDTFDDNEEGTKSKNYSERKIHYVYRVMQ
ncbi:4-amino-4-deoxy-L-arabinose transferase-like glycosyltransferase [Chryseobacterium defluvii]|uniref:4-amino-4-deoxy-L-arabinose transferase-like glycosyltransferase n=1 Tax=Chryseobacterium defluvii TaxID=160396 RepID=A0A840KEW2_9FLAO|nr:glycosyltransferase family 39 protein [Chryseobacterium defluvii]MBB4806264.1 4-amino-4-deoxy-L-arabinose transferase-like glycosyltransferase [Chryseobacterium defluvii]